MKKLGIIIFLYFLSCGPDLAPDPQPVNLIAPDNLEICTTGSRINNFEKQVLFQWTPALNADNYEVIVENSYTGDQFNLNTALLNASLILPSGFSYKWFVRSKSTLTPVFVDSETWQFYLEGTASESYFPFPATLIFPKKNDIISTNLLINYFFF